MNGENMKKIVDKLFSYQDLKFKEFNSKIIPNIDKSTIIGVKIPKIRMFAKSLKKEKDYKIFLQELPHKYLEENILHSILISLDNDLDNVLRELDLFLPYVDNWEVCDVIKPNIFKKDLNKVYEYVKVWVKSNDIYKIRFGIVTLLNYYLDDYFNEDINNLVLSIKNDDYYIKMAISWYFSYALIKQWDKTINIIEEHKLDKFTHNKTIQKCIDSYRISEKDKKYLKNLKIK